MFATSATRQPFQAHTPDHLLSHCRTQRKSTAMQQSVPSKASPDRSWVAWVVVQTINNAPCTLSQALSQNIQRKCQHLPSSGSPVQGFKGSTQFATQAPDL